MYVNMFKVFFVDISNVVVIGVCEHVIYIVSRYVKCISIRWMWFYNRHIKCGILRRPGKPRSRWYGTWILGLHILGQGFEVLCSGTGIWGFNVELNVVLLGVCEHVKCIANRYGKWSSNYVKCIAGRYVKCNSIRWMWLYLCHI